MGRASLDMSLTLIRIIISCTHSIKDAIVVTIINATVQLYSFLNTSVGMHGDPLIHPPLTTSLWSLLAKSKLGRMDLKLLSISLCLVMSVARIHLRVGEMRLKRLWWSVGVGVGVLRGSGGPAHLMTPSLMRLYSSAGRFLKMLL